MRILAHQYHCCKAVQVEQPYQARRCNHAATHVLVCLFLQIEVVIVINKETTSYETPLTDNSSNQGY
jgi:hypothetical protein